jgi:hypothetical protein
MSGARLWWVRRAVRRAHPGALHTSLLHELGQIPLWGNHLVCKALFPGWVVDPRAAV